MKHLSKVKLCQVGGGSNIAQNHSSYKSKGSYIWSLFSNSHKKLTKYEIRSSYYLLQFGFIYVYMAIFVHI